jgi:hypothetical protein
MASWGIMGLIEMINWVFRLWREHSPSPVDWHWQMAHFQLVTQ